MNRCICNRSRPPLQSVSAPSALMIPHGCLTVCTSYLVKAALFTKPAATAPRFANFSMSPAVPIGSDGLQTVAAFASPSTIPSAPLTRSGKRPPSIPPPSPVSFGLESTIPQCCGAWAPSGESYFFQAKIDGFFHIFAFDERRFALPRPAVQLTSGPANYRSPVPLPSGDRLLVLNQTQKAEVARYDPVAKRWVPLFEGIPAATVAFSPDGKTLAFTRLPDHSLWTCALPACSNPISLIPTSAPVSMPRWSPDGTHLSCMVRSPTGKWLAGTVVADASAAFTPLPGQFAEADPVWSPSGDRIAFGSTPTPDSGADASIRVYYRKSHRVETIPASHGLHSPAWSPDGRRLAAIRADTREISIFDFASAQWSRPLPSVRAGYLNWSASGHRLFFLASVLGKADVVLALDPNTRAAVQVADFSGFHRPVFSFGNWLGLGPGDTPLALRDLSTEDILSWPLQRD